LNRCSEKEREAVQPSEVRERVLSDHARSLERIAKIGELARAVARGKSGDVEELRRRGEETLADLREHIHWEDDYLSPALVEADAWGEERAKLLARDHREQRQLVDHLAADLRERTRPALLLAWPLLDFAQLLRQEMQWEEETLVDERVLRDDAVGVDETGWTSGIMEK